MIKLLFGLGVWFWLSSPVLAWNAEGHMIVAQIAYNHLDPAVKAKCDALVGVPLQYGGSQNNTFVTSACWADDYKSQLGTGIWHYIDLPFSLDGTSTSGFFPASFDVVQAINLCISTLGSGTASQTNQATFLRYLLHFVGDIQQPLHSSTAISTSSPNGDGGGNGFYITGTWNNLHSLWDSGGGYLTDSMSRPLSPASQTTLSNKVAAIEADYPYTPNIGTIPNPMDWAKENQAIAETVAYIGISRNTAPSTAYLNTAQMTTEQQMALGGHRLADLLNTLFTTKAVALTCYPTNGMLALSWSAIPGRTYHLQWKEQFSDPTWNALADIAAFSNSVTFSELPSQEQRFYRVTQ